MGNHGVTACYAIQVFSFHQHCLTTEEKAESWADSEFVNGQACAAENQVGVFCLHHSV